MCVPENINLAWIIPTCILMVGMFGVYNYVRRCQTCRVWWLQQSDLFVEYINLKHTPLKPEDPLRKHWKVRSTQRWRGVIYHQLNLVHDQLGNLSRYKPQTFLFLVGFYNTFNNMCRFCTYFIYLGRLSKFPRPRPW